MRFTLYHYLCFSFMMEEISAAREERLAELRGCVSRLIGGGGGGSQGLVTLLPAVQNTSQCPDHERVREKDINIIEIKFHKFPAKIAQFPL